jgi:hypothetical protein
LKVVGEPEALTILVFLGWASKEAGGKAKEEGFKMDLKQIKTKTNKKQINQSRFGFVSKSCFKI